MNRVRTHLPIFALFIVVACSADVAPTGDPEDRATPPQTTPSSPEQITVDFNAPLQFTEQVNEDGYPFDPYFKTERELFQALVDQECGPNTPGPNMLKRMDCMTEVRDRFVRAGRFRGTREFARKHYGDFDNDRLRARRDALEEARKGSRSYSLTPPPGVLKTTAFNTEIHEISLILGERQQAIDLARCEDVYGEGHKRCDRLR